METIKRLFDKYGEGIRYLFFGGLTTIVSIGSYALFTEYLGIHHLLANVYSWILAVVFAYITNKIWVFKSKQKSKKGLLLEIALFFGARLASLGCEELFLFLGIDILGANAVIIKFAAQVFVVIFNYILSKLIVFRKSKNTDEVKGE